MLAPETALPAFALLGFGTLFDLLLTPSARMLTPPPRRSMHPAPRHFTQRATPPPARGRPAPRGTTGVEFVVAVHRYQRFTAARSFSAPGEAGTGITVEFFGQGIWQRVSGRRTAPADGRKLSTVPEVAARKFFTNRSSSSVGNHHQPPARFPAPQQRLCSSAIFSASISPLTLDAGA